MKLQELFEDRERSILSVMGQKPEHISSSFSCYKKKLTSLEGAPSFIDGDFYCSCNDLTSLQGVPSSIGGHFSCYKNKLTSLHNVHKQIKHIGGSADFRINPIKSHVLGLLLIDGLQRVFIDNKKVQEIINNHLAGDRDVFACQEELIENGFEDFAQL